MYAGFLLMAPRLHALGKSRGYMTISEFLYDRYLPPSGAHWVSMGWEICSSLMHGNHSTIQTADCCDRKAPVVARRYLLFSAAFAAASSS